MALYLMKQIKDCILAVLDSTVDEKGVVHHQVLESDRNGRTPDDNESFDLERGTCVDLIFDLTATHKIQVYCTIVFSQIVCQC